MLAFGPCRPPSLLAALPFLVLALGCDQSNTAGRPTAGPTSTDSTDSRLAPPSPGNSPSQQTSQSVGRDGAGGAEQDSAEAVDVSSAGASTGIRDMDALYESWPQPDFVLAITGEQHGYVEPCGCTGLENQKGGMARRHTLFRQIAARGWPLVAVDAGNQVRRYGRQAELKFQVAADAMRVMGYDAISLGADDLRLSSLELVRFTHDDTQSTAFLSANAAVFDAELTDSYKIIERGGRKIGITTVIGQEWLDDIKNSDIVKTPPAEALKKVVPKFSENKCDVTILVAHATMDESRALGNEFSDFDVVVTSGGDGDPTFQPERLEAGGPLLVRVGEKAMHVGLLGFFREGEPLVRYQRIPLTDKFEDSSEMLGLLASYQEVLKDFGLEGLGLRPLPHPTGKMFVGSKQCQECHESAYEVWEESPHFHATDSLVNPPERGGISRHFDPECLSCHVTGWDPQNYQPYLSGYLDLQKSLTLHGSGCENCHGPGSDHVAAERGDDDVTEEVRAARRAAMQLPLEKAERHCMKCHDLDNSPDFHKDGAFAEYWEQIEHYDE